MVLATLVAFLPAWLERLGAAPVVIGLMMAVEPAAALLVGPWAGLRSDRLNSPLGRRLPFVIVAGCLAVPGFVGIGLAGSLAGVLAPLALVAVGMGLFFAPYRAMLADEFPRESHTVTSGLQSLFREAGGLTTFVLGAFLLRYGAGAPFFLAALGVALSFGWTCLAMARQAPSGVQPGPQAASAARLPWRSLARLMAAQGCWWFAIEAGKAFVVLFMVHDIQHVASVASPAGQEASRLASLALAAIGLSGLLCAVPLGLLARRVGAHAVLAGALALLTLSYAASAMAASVSQLFLIAPFFGAGFAALQVLSFPLLLEHRGRGGEGAAGSLYNALTYGPQLLAYPLMGALAQATGTFRSVLWTGAALFAVAIALMLGLKPAEASPLPAESPLAA